jgi:retron-type reverse transcriptase
MKRLNNLYPLICSTDNLLAAEKKAVKSKKNQYGVQLYLPERESNLKDLQNLLVTKTYKTSPYTIFPITDPKPREVYRLPFFPDRVAQHGIMNVLEGVFMSMYTADTYSCVKKRGIHGAHKNLKKALLDVEGTKYCLKIDIKKFYPSIDHDVLKTQLRRKFKDKDLLWLLDNIIDSAPGLPIGNYISQPLSNLYLTPFDYWLKEKIGKLPYFRYADDIVVLAPNKQYLHALLFEIKHYLKINLKLDVKENYQVFPVEARGIDFIGYKYFHTHVLLRKRIKQKFARAIAKNKPASSINSYMGWAKHANTKTLIKKLIYDRNSSKKIQPVWNKSA